MDKSELRTAIKIAKNKSTMFLATREHVRMMYGYITQYRKENKLLRREVLLLKGENECLKKRIEVALKD